MKKIFSMFLIICLLATLLSACGCKHEWEEATCEDPKTCEKCGKTQGKTADHNWKAATCKAPKTCKTCDKTKGETGDHKWEDATCEKPKTCKTCSQTQGEPAGHNWQNDICTACKATRVQFSENYGIVIDKNQADLKAKIDNILVVKEVEINAIIEKYMNGEEAKYVGVTSGTKDGNKAAEQLVVATNAEFAPWEYKEGNKYYGIDMEIAQLIANELGLELVIDDMEFDAVVFAVGNLDVDIAISGITISEEENSNILFSAPYYTLSYWQE